MHLLRAQRGPSPKTPNHALKCDQILRSVEQVRELLSGDGHGGVVFADDLEELE